MEDELKDAREDVRFKDDQLDELGQQVIDLNNQVDIVFVIWLLYVYLRANKTDSKGFINTKKFIDYERFVIHQPFMLFLTKQKPNIYLFTFTVY